MNNQHASSKLLFGTFYLRILDLFGFECEEELCLLTKTAEISLSLHLTRQGRLSVADDIQWKSSVGQTVSRGVCGWSRTVDVVCC